MLLVIAALAGAVADAGEIAGRKMAWAHYVPWFKPENASLEARRFYNFPLTGVDEAESRRVSTRREIDLAIASGIDGWFIDLGTNAKQGPLNSSGDFPGYLEAAEGTDFQIGICLDGRGTPEYLTREIVRLLKAYGGHPNYPRENGRHGVRAGDEVLHPATCHPMRRLSSVTRDIAPLLRKGENTVAVLLGNGWFNYITREGADFAHAPWAAAPAICGALVISLNHETQEIHERDERGDTVFVTDGDWTAYDSPVVFNAFRNGEWYDARREGLRENERPVEVVKYPPFAEVSPDDAPPCRTFDPVAPVASLPHPDGGTIYDFGTNRAGWCEIEVAGESGSKVTLDYDEALAANGRLLGYATAFVRANGDPRPAQHDEYTLAGRPGGERWHPRFAYHGFRYAHVRIEGKASLTSIRSVFVHSDLPSAGSIEIADPVFSRLQDAVRRVREERHRANFGILGSKWIPRVLALHGYIDDAWRLFTQSETPGFASWMRDGDTLREAFDDVGPGRGSRNHIMFGDFSAWAFEFLAGIRIVEPGFAKVEIRPHLPEGVESFDIRHRSPQGEIRVRAARRPDAAPAFSVTVPPCVGNGLAKSAETEK